jgi:hypothetical protein
VVAIAGANLLQNKVNIQLSPFFSLCNFSRVGGNVQQWRFSLQKGSEVINLPNGSEVIDDEEEQVCRIHRTCWKINWRIMVVSSSINCSKVQSRDATEGKAVCARCLWKAILLAPSGGQEEARGCARLRRRCCGFQSGQIRLSISGR